MNVCMADFIFQWMIGEHHWMCKYYTYWIGYT